MYARALSLAVFACSLACAGPSPWASLEGPWVSYDERDGEAYLVQRCDPREISLGVEGDRLWIEWGSGEGESYTIESGVEAGDTLTLALRSAQGKASTITARRTAHGRLWTFGEHELDRISSLAPHPRLTECCDDDESDPQVVATVLEGQPCPELATP